MDCAKNVRNIAYFRIAQRIAQSLRDSAALRDDLLQTLLSAEIRVTEAQTSVGDQA
jgi:hypothetical protein